MEAIKKAGIWIISIILFNLILTGSAADKIEQFGITWHFDKDYTIGRYANGGSWPSNGGHLMGRKWPILFAGIMLGDKDMSKIGNSKTAFQEDQDTFYVSEKAIEITHSPKCSYSVTGACLAIAESDGGSPAVHDFLSSPAKNALFCVFRTSLKIKIKEKL